MPPKPRHILLYGTLRAGQRAFLEYGLENALRPAGSAFVGGRLYDLGEYPGVVLDGSRPIRVERYEIFDEEVLNKLDTYEEFDPLDLSPFDPESGRGSVFVRRVIDVMGAPAYIYEYNRPTTDAVVIDDDDWLEFVRKRTTQSG